MSDSIIINADQIIEIDVEENGIACDLSDATEMFLHVKDAAGHVGEPLEAAFKEDGKDGKFEIEVPAGTFTRRGLMHAILWVTTPDGLWPTDPVAIPAQKAF